MDPERHTCTWKDEPVTLTVTEFLILQALASRPGVVKSRNALMDAAYDDQVYVDDRTIDSHIKRLRKKFKVGRRRLRHDRDAVRRRLPLQGSLIGPTRFGRIAVEHRRAQWIARTSSGRERQVLDRTAETAPAVAEATLAREPRASRADALRWRSRARAAAGGSSSRKLRRASPGASSSSTSPGCSRSSSASSISRNSAPA